MFCVGVCLLFGLWLFMIWKGFLIYSCTGFLVGLFVTCSLGTRVRPVLLLCSCVYIVRGDVPGQL